MRLRSVLQRFNLCRLKARSLLVYLSDLANKLAEGQTANKQLLRLEVGPFTDFHSCACPAEIDSATAWDQLVLLRRHIRCQSRTKADGYNTNKYYVWNDHLGIGSSEWRVCYEFTTLCFISSSFICSTYLTNSWVVNVCTDIQVISSTADKRSVKFL